MTRTAVLSRRALNRALLARQLLLERADLPVTDAVEHLVGLQAQEPPDPYIGLFARLEGFRPADLAELLPARRVVRTVLMRATIHLVTARDALRLRPLVQPVLTKELYGPWGRRVATMDVAAVVAAGREILAEAPLRPAQLGARLAQRWPDQDPQALAYAVRCLAPLVQVPPRGVWGAAGAPTHADAEVWLGRGLDPSPSLEDMVLRYLAAFGPATPGDIATWSRLTGMAPVVGALRPRLRTLTDERGRELVDVPGAPLPDPDTPAPPRFLPTYDNALLSHADRSRIVAEDDRRRLAGDAAVLVDGFVAGTWRIARVGEAATLEVTPLRPLPRADTADLEAEGHRLLATTAPGATHAVVITRPA
jgi:hypothetical protein